MTDSLTQHFRKKALEIARQIQVNSIQNDIDQAKLEAEIARRFRATDNVVYKSLAEMIDAGLIERENKYKLRLRK